MCKMRKIDYENCEWCNNDKHDVLHMLCECSYIREIWKVVVTWISTKLKCNLIIEKELVFLYDIEAGNYQDNKPYCVDSWQIHIRE